MAKRHKRDTATFAGLSFADQSRAISAQLITLERALLHHARNEGATLQGRVKLLERLRRFRQRVIDRVGRLPPPRR